MHHYGVALSPDGNFMTYAQGAFDEKAEAPFEEALYLFDFAQQSEAVYLDSREGGGRNQGPCFLGDGGSLVLRRGAHLSSGRGIVLDRDSHRRHRRRHS